MMSESEMKVRCVLATTLGSLESLVEDRPLDDVAATILKKRIAEIYEVMPHLRKDAA